MKYFLIIPCLLLILGCTKKVAEKDLHLLNGYWEIVEVTFPDGNKKKYKVNTSVDYLEIEDEKGFKKKVRPKLDGTFETSDDAELFSIAKSDKRLLLHYKNEMSDWYEEIIELTENGFSIKNEDGILYKYQRFEPINVEK